MALSVLENLRFLEVLASLKSAKVPGLWASLALNFCDSHVPQEQTYELGPSRP